MRKRFHYLEFVLLITFFISGLFLVSTSFVSKEDLTTTEIAKCQSSKNGVICSMRKNNGSIAEDYSTIIYNQAFLYNQKNTIKLFHRYEKDLNPNTKVIGRFGTNSSSIYCFSQQNNYAFNDNSSFGNLGFKTLYGSIDEKGIGDGDVAISESLANLFFANANPVGNLMTLSWGSSEGESFIERKVCAVIFDSSGEMEKNFSSFVFVSDSDMIGEFKTFSADSLLVTEKITNHTFLEGITKTLKQNDDISATFYENTNGKWEIGRINQAYNEWEQVRFSALSVFSSLIFATSAGLSLFFFFRIPKGPAPEIVEAGAAVFLSFAVLTLFCQLFPKLYFAGFSYSSGTFLFVAFLFVSLAKHKKITKK